MASILHFFWRCVCVSERIRSKEFFIWKQHFVLLSTTHVLQICKSRVARNKIPNCNEWFRQHDHQFFLQVQLWRSVTSIKTFCQLLKHAHFLHSDPAQINPPKGEFIFIFIFGKWLDILSAFRWRFWAKQRLACV